LTSGGFRIVSDTLVILKERDADVSQNVALMFANLFVCTTPFCLSIIIIIIIIIIINI